MNKKYIVDWHTADKEWTESFNSIEEIKDYCYPIWNVQRFQVHIDSDGNIYLTDKLLNLFAVVGELRYSDDEKN